ncbi:MAG: substrate-binding domain-containing protein [Pigmentiphaga sp.]|uniref:substrate-binding domain-containing protein n=1 Tax=Pigmentiphaga sp. TaxID=1977564 RepID=UPI0029B05C6E|nr:substrate-binding domain-containing protein [Pigmentiphaga sp.]MDX3906923.1 substrate-binding domain-containing protein [Pigmentiphaga sp.]
MFKIAIHPGWQVQGTRADAPAGLDTALLLRLLARIRTSGSIAAAGRLEGLSYRHVWGLLRDAERLFGTPLLEKQPGRGTRLSHLGVVLLLAEDRIRARLSPTLDSLASELQAEIRKAVTPDRAPLRLYASHGFAVAALVEWINAANMPVELRYRNSTEAVAALARRECDLAGFHVPLGQFEGEAVRQYLQWLDPREHVLVQLALREQGLCVAPGNPKRIGALADLARPGVRFVNRQAGSGTRMLLELMLARDGVPQQAIMGFDSTEFTHAAVAAYIASDMADVGFGIETAARRFGLDFVPLVTERYFFAVERATLEARRLDAVLGILKSPAFVQRLDALPGYRPVKTGDVLTLAQAFGIEQEGGQPS